MARQALDEREEKLVEGSVEGSPNIRLIREEEE
jgi:hypothetical protein